ncbi:M23 family metallopeptidase [Myxococcaceae bacterium GXIMD 01537]
MRPSLPTLGEPPKRSPVGPVVAVSLILGAAAGGVWWWKQRLAQQTAEAPPVAAAAEGSAPTAEAVPPPGGAPVAPTGRTAPAAAPAAAPADPLVAAGMARASVKIEGPLETALTQAAGAEVGPALAQVVTRTLVWWVDVPQGLLRGDALDVLYTVRPNEEPLVHAVRFVSAKTGQTHQAYRYQPQADATARYYMASGDELELRLEHSPLDDYEQVTSLLRDGRRHKGVDFRTPVGTPVKAPFSGVIKRKNWGWRANGNCLELEESGGKRRRALFLHLAELPKSIQPGDRVAVGQVIADSGNTGRSFAPHLHYQLMTQDDRVLDPFEQHRTVRRAVTTSHRPGFEAEVRRLDGLLGTTVAGK